MSTDQLTVGEILQRIDAGGLVLHQTDRYQVRLRLNDFRGAKRLVLRRYFPSEQGEMLPTKGGVPISFEALPLLVQALTAISEREVVV